MVRHGFLPDSVIESTITPVVKYKNGDITSASNYRPITIASTMSKIIENLILQNIEPHQNYNRLGSNIYACFIDASNAFDRVNHCKLYIALEKRKYQRSY